MSPFSEKDAKMDRFQPKQGDGSSENHLQSSAPSKVSQGCAGADFSSGMFLCFTGEHAGEPGRSQPPVSVKSEHRPRTPRQSHPECQGTPSRSSFEEKGPLPLAEGRGRVLFAELAVYRLRWCGYAEDSHSESAIDWQVT